MQKPKLDVLYSAATLQQRLEALGQQITEDYQQAGIEEICVLCVLKGSFLFTADLIRHIGIPLRCEFIGLSSYGNAQVSSGNVVVTQAIQNSLEGQDVLVVEDIIDSGLSMHFLLQHLQEKKTRSIKICTLLLKPDHLKIKLPIDYTGFEIANHFVVGYGLDFKGLYRNLPYVGVMRGEH